MFTENMVKPQNGTGWIELIMGSMFSGKTEELLRRIKRAKLANQSFELYKPKLESRYSANQVVSHDQQSLDSEAVESPNSILLLTSYPDVVGIDEAQFFDNSLIETCNMLANKGCRVIVAGLNTDYKGKAFGPVPSLAAIAEYITKLHAICVRCGQLANYSHRKSNETAQVVLGELDRYEPLCRRCFNSISG